jgi:hypothetical protein
MKYSGFFLLSLSLLFANILFGQGHNSTLKLNKNVISFTENKGQVRDQYFNPRPDVLFGGSAGKLVFHLKNNGISYQFDKVDSWIETTDKRTNDKRKEIEKGITYRLDIDWLNTNSAVDVLKGKAYDGYSNFYMENCPDGVTNVQSYDEITYQNIYNGIDLKWYQKNGRLKYDYIVSANANYKNIQLKIKGATAIQINRKGELIIDTPLGTIIEQAPLVIQNGKELSSKWILQGDIVTFDIKNINPNQSFIIDPGVRAWGTYYGDNNSDEARSCATDINGDIYMAGLTLSSGTLIATSGSHQSAYSGSGYDAFLAKFNSLGVRLWATYYGGTGNDFGQSCATDLSGNIYMAGYTQSATSTVIATSGSHQQIFGGTRDAFLVKFNGNGIRLWGTYYGGTGNDYGNSCTTDPSGNVYLTGETSIASTTVIATIGSHQQTLGGATDAFLVKFDASGVRLWGTYYGGTGNEIGYSCATDAAGDIYAVGITLSSNASAISSVGSHQSVFGGVSDAFIVKFNGSGVRQWGTYYGGSDNDIAYSCVTDNFANVYIAGTTYSTNAIASPLAHQTNFGGTQDAFLAKFNTSGVRQWGTYYGDTGNENGNSCAVDANGNIYLAGTTALSTGTIIATPGAHQTIYGGFNFDGFLSKFDSNGLRLWGSFYGGAGNDRATSCAVDAIGNVYLGGETNSATTTLIATPLAHQAAYSGGSNDAFLVKFNDCSTPANPIGSNLNSCVGNTATLSANSGTNTINWFATPSSTTVLGTGNSFVTPTLATGTYTYYAEAFTCVPSLTRTAITLTVNPNPTITVNSGSICSGNNFTINPTGASTYTLQGGSNVVSPGTNTSYTVIGTSGVGCVSANTATSTITVNTTPTIAVNSGSICSGNNFTINPTGASTYTIQGGSNVVTPGATASYTVKGTSAAGCVSANTATSTITVNTTPTIAVNNGSICSGNNFTINPTGASTYTIQGGSNVVSPGTSTSYTVIGTSAAGCLSSNTATSNVTVNTNPTITVNSGSICSGSNFTINPTGASTYTTQGGSNVVSPGASTSYTVTGTSAAGCLGNVATSNITVNALPVITVASATICAGATGTLTASGASTYTWSTGSNASSVLASPIITTTYTANGTSSAGCVGSAVTATITVGAAPSIVVNSATVCAGNSATLNASGVTTYTWNTGANSSSIVVTPTTTTTYSVSGNLTGCGVGTNNTASVTVNALPNITALSTASILCEGSTASITANGANTYTWNTGANTSVIAVSPSVTTTYTINGTGTNGCNNSTVLTQSVSACTSILSHALNAAVISAYPNPITTFLTLQSQELMDVSIYNTLGQVVYTQINFSGKLSISTTQWANGIYFVHFKSQNNSKQFKLIKQ